MKKVFKVKFEEVDGTIFDYVVVVAPDAKEAISKANKSIKGVKVIPVEVELLGRNVIV